MLSAGWEVHYSAPGDDLRENAITSLNELINKYHNVHTYILFVSYLGSLGSHSALLAQSGVIVHRISPNDSSVDSWISSLCADAVIFDRFIVEEQFGWRFAEHSPNTCRVMDTQDLHFLRRARLRALEESRINNNITLTPMIEDSGVSKESKPDELLRTIQNDINLHTDDSAREIASIYRCDKTLVLPTMSWAF